MSFFVCFCVLIRLLNRSILLLKDVTNYNITREGLFFSVSYLLSWVINDGRESNPGLSYSMPLTTEPAASWKTDFDPRELHIDGVGSSPAK